MIRRLVIIKIGISAFKIAENRKQKTKILLIFKNDLIIVNCNSVISSWINKIYWLKLEDAEWSTTELFTNQNGLSLQYVCYALLRITIYWNGHLHSFHTHTQTHILWTIRETNTTRVLIVILPKQCSTANNQWPMRKGYANCFFRQQQLYKRY